MLFLEAEDGWTQLRDVVDPAFHVSDDKNGLVSFDKGLLRREVNLLQRVQEASVATAILTRVQEVHLHFHWDDVPVLFHNEDRLSIFQSD